MFKNYFKTAFRSLVRNKTYSIINMAGLAAGIGVCMTIFIIIQYQSSFDNFHSKKSRIYRVLTEYHHADANEIFYGAGVPTALPLNIKVQFPQIENVATIFKTNNDQVLVINQQGGIEKKFKEEQGVFYTQPSFFEIFDFPLLAGSANSLNDPNSTILTKETAEKYFGLWQNAIGKSIKINNRETLKVTGILGTIPSNTDFQVKMLISFGTGWTKNFLKSTNWDGTGSSFGCYLLMPENMSIPDFNRQLRQYVAKMKSPGNKDSHIVQALTDIHFDNKTGNFSGKSMSHELINALWLIAAFIVLIACVNFINLSTAQAVNRAKEIGVRKVLGSNKSQLRLQLLTETFIIVLFSLLIATAISYLGLPAINRILDLHLSFNSSNFGAIMSFLGLMCLAVTVTAGFYPSLVLSRFNPIYALKSKLTDKQTKGISLRRGLVVFQFVIAQALIIGTLVILKQMNFFVKQPIGFDKSALVNIPIPTDSLSQTKQAFLKSQVAQLNGVQSVSYNSNTPIEDDNDNWSTFKFDHAIKETEFYCITKWCDKDYIPTYKLSLVAGRNIEPSDTVREFLVNEELVKKLGLKRPEDILNKEISMWDDHLKGHVVGVMKDFNNRSFRRELAPLLISSWYRGYEQASVRLTTADMGKGIQSLEKVWGQTYPEFVFEYEFLDDKISSFYKQENELAQLYKIFAVIAIFLSCLGLYGLASFMAVQRLKEVGIRKVLGATAMNIVYLFSREFVILISIALVIAVPIAWYYMNRWLQDYPFRIQISWWMFLAGGALSIAIALATVSFQAIRAALTNPVKSLRSE